MRSPGREVAALLVVALVGLAGCASDDGEEINPRPTSASFSPGPTPTPGQDPNP